MNYQAFLKKEIHQYFDYFLKWVKGCTWIIVLNKAPAILCSWDSANVAMNNVPAENTKSTPKTESHIAGNSRGQYVIDGLLRLNRRTAALVDNVATPEISGEDTRNVEKEYHSINIRTDEPNERHTGCHQCKKYIAYNTREEHWYETEGSLHCRILVVILIINL